MTPDKEQDQLFEIRGLDREPWVFLPGEKELSAWAKPEEIKFNQIRRQTEKYTFFVRSFDFVHENGVDGDYYEFGCHRARTFRMALTEARRHQMNEMKFFAFDSFEGLPPSQEDHGVVHWTQGNLCTSEADFMKHIQTHGIYVDRVRTIKGFYQDSLTPKLQTEFMAGGRKASFVNVDCDLYDSAVPVFKFIEPFLQKGTVMYIDDYFGGHRGSPDAGVPKAFHEFEQVSKFKFCPFLSVGWWGKSFIAY